MTRADLEHLRAVLRAELAPMRAQLDGLPLMARRVAVIQQEVRLLRAAFNDFALTNPTSGEIEALHTDVSQVQAENAELAAKVATLERLVHELQGQPCDMRRPGIPEAKTRRRRREGRRTASAVRAMAAP